MEDTQSEWQVAAVTRTGGWVGMAAGQAQVTDNVPGLVGAPMSLLGLLVPLLIHHLPNGLVWQSSLSWHGCF